MTRDELCDLQHDTEAALLQAIGTHLERDIVPDELTALALSLSRIRTSAPVKGGKRSGVVY